MTESGRCQCGDIHYLFARDKIMLFENIKTALKSDMQFYE